MAYEKQEQGETIKGGGSTSTPTMTLQQAIDLGEYNPEYLATFPQWHTMSRHMQFQYIRKAIENRRGHLLTQYAAINNILDFRLKPGLKEALRNIENQLSKLEADREDLYVEYSR